MNLPTPSLPTDNLYKFIAISGLVLVVTAIIIPLQLQNQIDREVTVITPLVRNAGRIADANHNKAIAEAKARLATPTSSQAQSDNHATPSTQSSDSLIEGEKTIEESETKWMEVESDIRSAQRTIAVAVSAGLVGVTMMIFGFVQWYRKVQRYQDEIVFAEAQKTQARPRKH